MSNIVITRIVGVGQYAVPASDIELALGYRTRTLR